MKSNFIKYGLFALIAACLAMTGCQKLDQLPHDKFTDATYWTSESKANSVVGMAYRQMYNSDFIILNEILTNNVYNGYGTSPEKIISTGQADASNGRFQRDWQDAYGGIKTCHTFLANIHRVPAEEMSQEAKDLRTAEIRFIRAFLYFQLVTWYGDVPFFTEDISLEESKTIARTSQTTIKAWIHDELEAVAEVLPSNNDLKAEDRGRITSGAAVALNARAYLYESNWTKVVENTTKLVNSTDYGTYGLYSSYEKLFWQSAEYNNEIIFSYEFALPDRTWGNLVDYAPMSANARLCNAGPTQNLVDSYLMKNGEKWTTNDPAYQNRDPRMGATIVYHGSKWLDREGEEYTITTHPVDGTDPAGKKTDRYTGAGTAQTPTGYYYRKYCDPSPKAYKSGGWDNGNNIPLIRFADVLLMHAEAKNEISALSAADWDGTIKLLRKRAGFENFDKAMNRPSADQTALREVIRNERRVELALEGLYIFDLRRWKTAETELRKPYRGAKFDNSSGAYDYISYEGGNFSKDRDYLWAIPRHDILLNKNLTQNPGY